MCKHPCGVIRDLLPLYEEKLCSKESKRIVEEHLETCETCKAFYANMHEKLPEIQTDDKKEKESMLGLMDEIEKKIKFRQVVIVGLIILLIAGISAGATMAKETVYPIQAKDVKIKNLCMLEDERLFFSIKSKYPVSYTSISEVRSAEEKYPVTEGYQTIELSYSLWDQWLETCKTKLNLKKDSNLYEMNFIIPIEQPIESLVDVKEMELRSEDDNDDSNKKRKSVAINELYYSGLKLSSDVVTIWKDGDKIPKASDKIQKQVDGYEKQMEENGDKPDQFAYSIWSNLLTEQSK